MYYPWSFRQWPARCNFTRRPSRLAAPRQRLELELMEDRRVLSTLFIVPAGGPLDSTHFLRYQDAYQAAVAGDTIQVEAGTAISSMGAGVQGFQVRGTGAAAGTSSMEIDNSSIEAGELVQVSGGGGADETELVDHIRLGDRGSSTLFFAHPLANAHDGSGGQVTTKGILGIGKQLTIQGDSGAPAAIAANMEVLSGVTGVTFRNVTYLGFDSLTLDAGSQHTSILDSRLTRVTEVIGPNLGNQGNVLARNVITGSAVMDGDFSITTGDQILNNVFVTSNVTSLLVRNNNGVVIQGNTFITAGSSIQGIGLTNCDGAQVRNNLITVSANATSGGILLSSDAFLQGAVMRATIANNTISSAGLGFGLGLLKNGPGTQNLVVSALGNDFHNNGIGIRISGDSTSAGVLDLGTRSVNGEGGGNNFRSFTAAGAASGKFAISLENTSATANVSASNNLWSVADPSTVVKDGSHNTPTGGFTGTGSINVGTTQLTDSEEFVATLYEQFLGRVGTNQEWDGWAAALPSLGQSAVANGIARSFESLKRIVDGLYVRFLRRTADSGGEAGFIGFLQQGGTEEQTMSAMLGSPEYLNRVRNTFGDIDSAFIQSLYNNVLSRNASAVEVQSWVSALPSLGRSTVINAFVGSQEFRANTVNQFFMRLLHRAPVATELSDRVNSAQDLLTIQIGIASLPEYLTNG